MCPKTGGRQQYAPASVAGAYAGGRGTQHTLPDTLRHHLTSEKAILDIWHALPVDRVLTFYVMISMECCEMLDIEAPPAPVISDDEWDEEEDDGWLLRCFTVSTGFCAGFHSTFQRRVSAALCVC